MSETPGGKLFQRPQVSWLVNALIFQVGWFVCVLGGDLWAAIFTLSALVFHLRIFPEGLNDSPAIAIAVFLGLVHDNLLAYTGVLVFAESAHFSPVWLWCLWALLGMTLRHSLKWIYDRPLISAVAGAVSGPLAYAGGVALSNASLGLPLLQSLAIMATLWLFILPLHRLLEYRIDLLCR